jgi:hypothetical protein
MGTRNDISSLAIKHVGLGFNYTYADDRNIYCY